MSEKTDLGRVIVQERLDPGIAEDAWVDHRGTPDFGTSVPKAEAWMEKNYEDGCKYRWARVGPVLCGATVMVPVRSLKREADAPLPFPEADPSD